MTSPQNPLAVTASMPMVTIDDKAAAVYSADSRLPLLVCGN